MRSFLLKTGWVLAAVTAASFFLSWITLETAAFNRVAERQRVANQMEAEADLSWYQRYLGLRAEDSSKAVAAPFGGISGLSLVEWARSGASVHDKEKARNVAEAFGCADLRVPAVVAYAIPALAILGMVLFTVGFGSRLPVLLAGAAAAGLYFLVRYRLEETLLDRTVLGIAPGLGLWLALYALGLVGLILILDGLLPASQR